MGAMAGFVVGYLLGAKEGPEGLARLRRSWKAVSESEEFQSLVATATDTAMHFGSQLLERVQGGAAPAGDAKEAKDDSWASDNPADHRAGGPNSVMELLGTLIEKGKEMFAQHTGGGGGGGVSGNNNNDQD